MINLEEKNYKIFDMFSNQWAIVTAGNTDSFNGCTIGWGDMGTLWKKSVITVYIHPARYTHKFITENDTFTVSFFPEEYKKALGIMGSRSGRDCDKVKEAGLTPVSIGDSVTYKEANLTFLCKKLYQHCFDKNELDPQICDYYKNTPRSFPVDENGDWHPHWMYVGEIIDVIEGSGK